MGDAIVDVIASCDDEFLRAHNLPKGSMQLLTPEQADELYAAMGVAREMSRRIGGQLDGRDRGDGRHVRPSSARSPRTSSA